MSKYKIKFLNCLKTKPFLGVKVLNSSKNLLKQCYFMVQSSTAVNQMVLAFSQQRRSVIDTSNPSTSSNTNKNLYLLKRRTK